MLETFPIPALKTPLLRKDSMSSPTIPQRRFKGRLPQHVYDTAYGICRVKDQYTKAEKDLTGVDRFISRILRGMSKATGIEIENKVLRRPTDNAWQAHRAVIEMMKLEHSIYLSIKRGEEVVGDERKIQSRMDKLYDDLYEQVKAWKSNAPTATKTVETDEPEVVKQIRKSFWIATDDDGKLGRLIENNSKSPIGTKKDDVFRFTLDGKVRDGDFVCYYIKKREVFRVDFLWEQEDGTYWFTTEPEYEHDGWEYQPDEIIIIGYVVRVERGGLPVRLTVPLRGLPYADEPEVEIDPNAATLAHLKSKLDRLKGEADITNETAIFRLEKQIFDLEHPLDDSILDAEEIG